MRVEKERRRTGVWTVCVWKRWLQDCVWWWEAELVLVVLSAYVSTPSPVLWSH